MDLLTKGNPKTAKGESLGFLTYALHLAPHKSAGLESVCPAASPGCIAACLNKAGRGGFDTRVAAARRRKARMLLKDPAEFHDLLMADIERAKGEADDAGQQLAIRLNATSDIDWLDRWPHLFDQWGDYVWFYDYTKRGEMVKREDPRWNLTFSLSENNSGMALRLLREKACNVAVVAEGRTHADRCHTVGQSKVYGELRKKINGDEHDLRFLDEGPGNLVVLSPKGPAKNDTTGFVLR